MCMPGSTHSGFMTCTRESVASATMSAPRQAIPALSQVSTVSPSCSRISAAKASRLALVGLNTRSSSMSRTSWMAWV